MDDPTVIWFGPVARSQVGAPSSDVFYQCVGAQGTPLCEEIASTLAQVAASKGIAVGTPLVVRAFSAGGDAVKKLLRDPAARDLAVGVVLSDATYQKHGDDEGFIAYGTEAANGQSGRVFVATASSGGSSRGISDSESMDALRQRIEERTGKRFVSISAPWATKQPVKALQLGNTVLLDFGGAYTHGEHATALAKPVWDNVAVPLLRGQPTVAGDQSVQPDSQNPSSAGRMIGSLLVTIGSFALLAALFNKQRV